MAESNPIKKSKAEYNDLIDQIKSDTAVGIDAPYTHAIIIEYLQQISNRLTVIEEHIKSKDL